MEKIVLGLSGGVDSAAAALLLRKQGWAVHGLYLDNGTPGGEDAARACAQALDIPLAVRDIRGEMERQVCAPFAACYLRGETPNPCVLCNLAVKLPALLAYADSLGAEKAATGHYARVRNGHLYRGISQNDQSYMLCRLSGDQISRLVLPLGELEKTQVRALAREAALPPADKPDSMEICFIPDNDYVGWLEQRGSVPPPGDFVDAGGRVLGRHLGIHRYTVGQRRGLDIAADRRLYVREIRPEKDQVVLSYWEDLFTTALLVRDMRWIGPTPEGQIRSSIRVRHTRWEQPTCTVTPLGNGLVRVDTDSPLRAPAPGQTAAVFSEDGQEVLGGGFICGGPAEQPTAGQR